jgi:methylmalonyl-CoA/ethylmalonyl-CoA epimerase
MAGEETKHWTFHHLGVIVNDIEKAAEYYKSLGFVDFPPETAGSGNQAVWEEITSYGETIIKDGQPQITIEPGSKPIGIKFCRVGSTMLELIQPGDGIKEVNSDFLKNVGEGIDHIAYTVGAEHFEQEVEKMKAKGLPVLFSGRQTNGGGFVYFDTRKVGGIIIELMLTTG